MTITFNQTARDIIQGAFHDRGIYPPNEDVDAAHYSYAKDQLDMLLKDMAADGVTPWTRLDGTATFAADTATVILDPRPVGVLDARLQVSATYDRPLTHWEPSDYVAMPNKAQSGQPLVYTVTETPTAVSMTVWPVPSSEVTVAYTYTRVIEDLSDSSAPDVPQMWFKALRTMLAAELSPFESNAETPVAVVMKAQAARSHLYDFERPESYTIESGMNY